MLVVPGIISVVMLVICILRGCQHPHVAGILLPLLAMCPHAGGGEDYWGPLPSSGGGPSKWFYICGAIVIVVGIVLLVIAAR